MKTSIAQIASNVISSDVVSLSVDAATLDTLHAAIESARDAACAVIVKHTDDDVA